MQKFKSDASLIAPVDGGVWLAVVKNVEHDFQGVLMLLFKTRN